MAECYHFDCKPSNSTESDFKTLRSKFNGTCRGCGEQYAENDKIAYFGNKDFQPGQSRPAGSAPSGKDPEVVALKKELADLKKAFNDLVFRFKKTEGLAIDLNGQMIAMFSTPDKAPTKQAIASTEQVAEMFKGNQVETTTEDAY